MFLIAKVFRIFFNKSLKSVALKSSQQIVCEVSHLISNSISCICLIIASPFLFQSLRFKSVLVHPHRNVQISIIEVLRRAHQRMATVWVVVQLAFHTHTLQAVVVEVRLMRRHSLILLPDQKH